MRERMCNLKKHINNNRGETIMEAMASLLIFSILMLTVSVMITASLALTSDATARASERQQAANMGVLREYTAPSAAPAAPSSKLTITIATAGVSTGGVDLSVGVTTNNGFMSFGPEVKP